MSYYPNQRDINILFQSAKHIYGKVEILNSDFVPIERIDGEVIDDSYNIDATSDIRRTYSCTLQVTSSTVDFNKDSTIWFDKYIQPYVGIYDIRQQKILWYLKGTYSSADANHVYNESTNTLSLQCNDLMCRLTGDLDGKQPALSFSIPVGEDIRGSIIGILRVFGFTKYRIEALNRRVEHNLEFGANATAHEMIAALMEFCPNYEYFFDLDGTFVVQRIPCYTNDVDVLTDDVLQRLLVSQDSYSVKFTAKNCVEVWGKSYDEESVDRMAESCTYSGGTYTVTLGGEPLLSLPDFLVFAATVKDANAANCKMKIVDSKGTNLGTFDLYDDYNRKLTANVMEPNTTYLFFLDIDEEIVSATDMKLRGAYAASTTYNYNDVVITDVGKGMNTYIARPANKQPFSGKSPSDTSYWKLIKFTETYVLKGYYSSNTTYQPTEMVMYNGKLYYCLKANTKGIAPRTNSAYWQDHNLNVNSIKINNRLRYRGHMTAHGIYKNQDDSKFSIKDMGREYWEICSGGEYDNITSDALAVERAMYECYYKASLNETLTLTLLDVPWLDVNEKVSYTRQCYDIPERWIINSISSETLSGTCSVTLNKFYPDWSEVTPVRQA